MSVISIKLNEDKKEILRKIALLENKTFGDIIFELIEDYISKNKDRLPQNSEQTDLKGIIKLSEDSFAEWDNKDDEIYDKL